MEKIIGLKELRNNVAAYAARVSKGDSFVVVKQSKPLFKIVPVIPETTESYNDPNYKTLLDFTKIRKGGVPVEQIVRALIEIERDGQSKKSHRKVAKRTKASL